MALDAVVIAGAGHAGFQCATSLRQLGFDGRIVLIGNEDGLPYQRPPLSKAYLLGRTTVPELWFRSEQFFVEQRITLVSGDVEAIDRPRRRVCLRDGQTFTYDHLVLAVGGRHRPLHAPGANCEGVFGLQTLSHADALRRRLDSCRHAVVVGAGFIGLEFAAVARSLGVEVHVLELADRPMARAVSVDMGRFFASAHRRWGTGMHFGAGVAEVVSERGVVRAVVATDGQRFAADLVLVGIGAVPNVELATKAGLKTENGIWVDECLLTSDPSISAIGDVASLPGHRSTGRVRLESVQNAGDQARIAAARIVDKPVPRAAVPWFWSDQGEFKLQIAGLADADSQQVVSGNPAEGNFSVLRFTGDTLTAVESVNRPADHVVARRLLASEPSLSPSEAAVPGFDLKVWVSSRAR